MAHKASFKDLFVFLAIGKNRVSLQRHYIALQSQQAGKRDRKLASAGRAYYSQVGIESAQQIPAWRALCTVGDWVKIPLRFFAEIGQYDAARSR